MENRRRGDSGKVPATRFPDGSAQGWPNERQSADAELEVSHTGWLAAVSKLECLNSPSTTFAQLELHDVWVVGVRLRTTGELSRYDALSEESLGGSGSNFQPIIIWFLVCHSKDHGYAVYRPLMLEPQSLYDKTVAELLEPSPGAVTVHMWQPATSWLRHRNTQVSRTSWSELRLNDKNAWILAPVELLTTIQNTTLHAHVKIRILDQ